MNQEFINGGNPAPQTTGAPILSPVQKNPPLPCTKADVAAAVLVFLCGYLFTNWIMFSPGLNLGVTLFTIVFCGISLAYLKLCHVVPARSSWGWLGLTLVTSLQFSIFSNSVLKFFNLIFLMLCAVYWIACVSGTRLENSLGKYFTSDLINQFFKVPFLNFGCSFKVLYGAAVKGQKSRRYLAVLGGVLLAVPLLCVIVPQLMFADATFEALVDSISIRWNTALVEFLFRLPFAVLVGCYLFGLLYGDFHHRYADTMTTGRVELHRESRRKIPVAMAGTAVALLCIVYAVFLAAQVAGLVAALVNGQPQGDSFAEFARRGFFELCKVAAINLAVMFGVYLFTRRQKEARSRLLRALNILLSAETLLLIFSAFGKMGLYIGRYGLTRLRAYTSWFMLLLGLTFVLILLRQFKEFNLVKCLCAAFVVSFTALCWSNADVQILRYNIARYQAGTLDVTALDFSDMPQETWEACLSDILGLYQTLENGELKMEISDKLTSLQENFQSVTWKDFNWQQYRAGRMLEEQKQLWDPIPSAILKKT